MEQLFKALRALYKRNTHLGKALSTNINASYISNLIYG